MLPLFHYFSSFLHINVPQNVLLRVCTCYFFLSIANRKGKTAPLVKFSEDPDLENEECWRLLDKYTPPHMKHNKTTQKLFVRYLCELEINVLIIVHVQIFVMYMHIK